MTTISVTGKHLKSARFYMTACEGKTPEASKGKLEAVVRGLNVYNRMPVTVTVIKDLGVAYEEDVEADELAEWSVSMTLMDFIKEACQ